MSSRSNSITLLLDIYRIVELIFELAHIFSSSRRRDKYLSENVIQTMYLDQAI